MGHLIRGREPDTTGRAYGDNRPRDDFFWEIYRNARLPFVPANHWLFAFCSSDWGQERHIQFVAEMDAGYRRLLPRQSITLPGDGRTSYVQNTWPVGGEGTLGYTMYPHYRSQVLLFKLGLNAVKASGRGSGDLAIYFDRPFEPGDAILLGWGGLHWPPNEG